MVDKAKGNFRLLTSCMNQNASAIEFKLRFQETPSSIGGENR